jgi:predicted transcriptional regulator
MSKGHYTIALPLAVGRRVVRAAKKQKRNPSDVAVEALHTYFSLQGIPEETPTAAEMRAIRRGRAAFKRGDYITLDDLRSKEALARRPRRVRAKVS